MKLTIAIILACILGAQIASAINSAAARPACKAGRVLL